MKNSHVLVTGANRGIGRSLVIELMKRGASKVYATARKVHQLDDLVAAYPGRVIAIELDVTDPQAAAALGMKAPDVNILINNAGVFGAADVLSVPMETIRQDFETNFFGLLFVLRALVPVIERNGAGAIVNLSSIIGLAPMPSYSGYCASKAAVHSLTQGIRGKLAGKNIAVHGVYPGPVDTEMTKDLDMPKATPEAVAVAIVDGIEQGTEEIFPDSMSSEAGAAYAKSPKSLEAMLAGY